MVMVSTCPWMRGDVNQVSVWSVGPGVFDGACHANPSPPSITATISAQIQATALSWMRNVFLIQLPHIVQASALSRPSCGDR